MEWLWLLLFLAGLGVLWLIIMGLERLIRHVKMQDDTRRANARLIENKIEREEADFVRVRAAKDYLENLDPQPLPEGAEVPAEFKNAIETLSSDEILDSMMKKAFGRRPSPKRITAAKSALDVDPTQMAVANGNGVIPVKSKSSRKSGATKSEQKIYKKIKRGA